MPFYRSGPESPETSRAWVRHRRVHFHDGVSRVRCVSRGATVAFTIMSGIVKRPERLPQAFVK